MFVIAQDDNDFWATEEEASNPVTYWIDKSDLMRMGGGDEFDSFTEPEWFEDFVNEVAANGYALDSYLWLYQTAGTGKNRIEVVIEGASEINVELEVRRRLRGQVSWIVRPEYTVESGGFLYWDEPDSGDTFNYTFTVMPILKLKLK